MEYRIATENDIEILLQSRKETLKAVNHLGEDYTFSDEFLETSRKYFLKGNQLTVLAMDGKRNAGCATMCFLEIMPTYSHPSGLRAHLMNVYTGEEWRRQGIAFRMVSMLIEETWRRGVTEISLDATESGRPLYLKLGFRDSGECMVLENCAPR